MIRFFLPVTAAALLSAGAARASTAPCTPGPNWTQSWTGASQTTTYTISAPPCVYVNVPFDIDLTASESNPELQNSTVGMKWSVRDSAFGGAVIGSVAGATVTGFAEGDIVPMTGGTWTNKVTVTFTSLIVNHDISFHFQDCGASYCGGMNWPTSALTTLTGVTLDPYPPGSEPPPEDPPADPPATDPTPTPTDPSTGCASGGGNAGLVALFGLAALALRRRRA